VLELLSGSKTPRPGGKTGTSEIRMKVEKVEAVLLPDGYVPRCPPPSVEIGSQTGAL